MNKYQWYVLGTLFLILSIWFSIMAWEMRIYIVHNLIGTPCIIVGTACWICGWLGKEEEAK